MMPLESLRMKPHHIAGAACGLDALALLSATGYCETGALPLGLYAVIAPALLLGGVILYQLTMRLYRDDRHRQRRAERVARLDNRLHLRQGTRKRQWWGKKRRIRQLGVPEAG